MAISKFSALRTLSNFFIASLAVADISVGVLMNPVYASIFIVNATENNHPLRVTEHWLWLQTTVVSTFTLTAVSIERHIAATKCIRYTEIVTLNRCIYGIASIWIFSIMSASQRFLFHGRWGSSITVDLHNNTIRTKEFRMAFLKVLRVKSKSWEMDICGLQFKWSQWGWISKHVHCPVLERKTYSLSMQKKVQFTDPFGVMMKLQKFVNTQNVA